MRFLQEPHGVTSQKMPFFISIQLCFNRGFFVLKLLLELTVSSLHKPNTTVTCNITDWLSIVRVQTQKKWKPDGLICGKCGHFLSQEMAQEGLFCQ
jgi:hypothetical protein